MKRSQWILVLGGLAILGVSGCGGSNGDKTITGPPPPTVLPVTPVATPRTAPRPTPTANPCPAPNKYHEEC